MHAAAVKVAPKYFTMDHPEIHGLDTSSSGVTPGIIPSWNQQGSRDMTNQEKEKTTVLDLKVVRFFRF